MYSEQEPITLLVLAELPRCFGISAEGENRGGASRRNMLGTYKKPFPLECHDSFVMNAYPSTVRNNRMSSDGTHCNAPEQKCSLDTAGQSPATNHDLQLCCLDRWNLAGSHHLTTDSLKCKLALHTSLTPAMLPQLRITSAGLGCDT